MKITIVGGGNIGTQFMVHCAEKGHDVTAFTSKPEIFSSHLTAVDENDRIIHSGDIVLATNDPHKAFAEAELIIITYPSTMMKEIADVIYKYGDTASMIGVVPGNGGSECAFKECIHRGNVFFAIERVPAIARLIKKGKSVKSVGYRNELHIASIPSNKVDICCKTIANIFDIPVKPIPNLLNLTITPSNPILHTTRLRIIFKDYEPGVLYDELPLFYEDWDDESSELLLACDEEVQKICRALPEFNLKYVKSLREHYESQTVHEMTEKIKSIQAFKGLKTPAVDKEGKLVPDFHSRYFTADFSYGLIIIKQIASFAGVMTPNIDNVINWYLKLALVKDCFRYSDYGIRTRKDFDKFYLR